MKIIELLKKIDCEEIKDGTIFYGGSLFYKLIVINGNLYLINISTKELKLVGSGLIGNFITNDYDIYEYKMVLE